MYDVLPLTHVTAVSCKMLHLMADVGKIHKILIARFQHKRYLHCKFTYIALWEKYHNPPYTNVGKMFKDNGFILTSCSTVKNKHALHAVTIATNKRLRIMSHSDSSVLKLQIVNHINHSDFESGF
jgi:hypothetical protein